MNDERLAVLNNAVAEPTITYGQVRINRIKITNYKFFYGVFELPCNGQNVLIYGENGSGKSSIYRALEFLTKTKFEAISQDKNIFAEEGEPLIEFAFTNGKELVIHSDLSEIPYGFDYIKGLSLYTPMLDYKKLLKIHYSPLNGEIINIYDMFRNLFKDYPLTKKETLSDIKEPTQYFNTLKKIINDELLEEVNSLIRYFSDDFKIDQFVFGQKFSEDGSTVEPIINIQIDFKDNILTDYHTFLNEARLSALAVSLYFAAIRKLFGTLKKECIKILVLDDLLISLDMGNRFKLLEILKNRFNDFQIFFFTHDKALFDNYQNKMEWKKYELYLDDSEIIQKVIIKKSSSDLERAKEFYSLKDYDCSALLLRKYFEKLLKSYLTPKEQRDKNCNDLNLSGLIGRAASKSSGEAKTILEKLDSDREHILNPLCHYDTRNIHSQEIKSAISDMEKLKELLK